MTVNPPSFRNSVLYFPAVAEVDAADEGVELVDHDDLLVVSPQVRVHVCAAVRVTENLQFIPVSLVQFTYMENVHRDV